MFGRSPGAQRSSGSKRCGGVLSNAAMASDRAAGAQDLRSLVLACNKDGMELCFFQLQVETDFF